MNYSLVPLHTTQDCTGLPREPDLRGVSEQIVAELRATSNPYEKKRITQTELDACLERHTVLKYARANNIRDVSDNAVWTQWDALRRRFNAPRLRAPRSSLADRRPRSSSHARRVV